jgi:hypothetical protein
MAIPIKPEKGEQIQVQELSSNYQFFDIPNIPGFDSNFVLDLDSGQWYVFDKLESAYVAYKTPIDNPFEDADFSSFQIPYFTNIILSYINQTAVSFGYDSIDNAISYYHSDNVVRREDAFKFKTWRDNTISLMQDNIDNFISNGITLPDLSGFTSQPEYIEFNAIQPETFFFGDENFGYKKFEDNTFICWVNVQHNTQNSGLGQNIPIPDGESVKKIYSISGIVDQGSLTSDWLSLDYTLKIKLNGNNIYNTPTNFDYKVQAINGVENVYQGLTLRFNIFGSF